MITAAATVILALLTGIYVWLTHKLLGAQSDPYVVVYARSDDLRPTLIELIIHNVGKSVATDIRFEFSRPIFWMATGITERDASPGEPMVKGPFVTGIPALGPGDMRRILWGQFGGIKKTLGDDTISVTTRFRDSASRDLEPVISRLDVRSFACTDTSERDPMLRLLREVKELREAVVSVERTLSRALNREQSQGGPEKR